MENTSYLGIIISEHTENQTAAGSTLLIGIACLGLSVGMYFLFAGEQEMSFDKVLFGISGLAAFGGGIGCLWTVYKNRGGRIEIYENGLVIEKGNKRQMTLWSEIVAVQEKIEPMYLKGRYVYDRYNYTIKKTDGDIFVLTNMISGIDEIGRVVKEKTGERFAATPANNFHRH